MILTQNQENTIPDILDSLKRAKNTHEATLASKLKEVKSLENNSLVSQTQMVEAVKKYNYLGLRFNSYKSGDLRGQVSMAFNLIDHKAPDREFYFDMSVNSANIYESMLSNLIKTV